MNTLTNLSVEAFKNFFLIIIIIINGKDDELCSTIFGLDGHALISYAISVVTQLIKQAHCKSHWLRERNSHINPCCAEWIKMPRPRLIFNQIEYLIQICWYKFT